MKTNELLPSPCAEAREALRSSWVSRQALGRRKGQLEPHTASKSSLELHPEACPACRLEAEYLDRMDRSIETSFHMLNELTLPPTEDHLQHILLKTREEAVEAQVLRKIRKPVRMMLWGVFFAFTLLACSFLAYAVMKALKAGF